MALIVRGTNENFQKALNNRNVDSLDVRLPKSLRAFGNQDKIKNASILQKTGMLETSRNAPLFNDPRYTSSTLAIPTDERSLHGLYRFFAETDPIVGAALKVLTELPLAGLRLGICEDTGVQQHYEEQWERINGFNLANDAVAEYHEIGLATLFGSYNESDYMWDQFAILNPDYVKVESTWINATPLIKLIPDEALKKIVQTQSPRILYDQIPAEIRRYVLFNQEIPLDPNHTFLLTHAKRPYETKGRSVIKRILKILMLEDRFNQANFALATRHAVPFTVAKVGDPNLNWLPSDDDLKDVQEAISAFELDPNFCFVTHPGFNIEYYGSNGRSMPVGPELDRIYRLKFIGLGVHEQLLAGQGGSYSVTEDHCIAYREENGNRIIKDFKSVWESIDVPVMVDAQYEIKDVQTLNMQTLSLDRNGNKKWSTITKLIRHKLIDTDKLLDVKTSTACITATEGHGFMWLNPDSWEYEEVSAKKLQSTANATVVDILDLAEFGKRYSEIWCHTLSPEMAYFLGVWNADGCIGIRNGYDLIFSNNNINLINHVQQITEKLSFNRVLLRPRPTVGEYTLYLHWKELKYDLMEFYQLSKESTSFAKTGKEHIPEEILFNSDPDIVGAYVAGELDGDGSVSYNQVAFVSASKKFLIQFSFMLRRFGIIPNPIMESPPKKGYTKFNASMNMYSLYISDGGSFKKLYNLIQNWIGVDYKKENLKRLAYKTSRQLNRNMYVNKRKCKDSILINRNRVLQSGEYSQFEKDQASKFDTVRVVKVMDSQKLSNYVYDLELADNPHTYMVCSDGWLLNHNSSAYMSLEVQRQRYLNLQLKLEQLFHTGIFKPIAEVCGFYRVRQATAGYAGVTKIKYAKEDRLHQDIRNAYKAADYKNPDFIEFINRKTAEYKKEQVKTTREYVYPKLDFGALNAAYDENMKNYVKWMNDKYPELVDSGLIARLAKLDRDDQLKAKKNDLRRMQQWLAELQKEGLLDMYLQSTKKGGAGGGGDMGPIDMGTGGALNIDNLGGGGEPGLPTGVGGAPETAEGVAEPAAPGGAAASEDSLKRLVFSDDVAVMKENRSLLKQRKT